MVCVPAAQREANEPLACWLNGARQHNSSYCYVFFDDVCKGFGLTIAEVAEALETGAYAFHLLQEYPSVLGWGIET